MPVLHPHRFDLYFVEQRIRMGMFQVEKIRDGRADVYRSRGGHGALPERAIDPVVASAQLIIALQSVVSREIDPDQAVVLTPMSRVPLVNAGSRTSPRCGSGCAPRCTVSARVSP